MKLFDNDELIIVGIIECTVGIIVLICHLMGG